MSFISDIGKNISSKGKELSQKAKVMSETSSLNNIVKAEEYKIDFQYKTIGKLYFEKYQDDPGEEFSEAVEIIKGSMEKIQQTKEEINKIKSRFNCPKCGAPFKNGALFCSKCGEKLPENEKPIDKNAVPDGAQKCEKCGNILKKEALFCNSCGNKLQPNSLPTETTTEQTAAEPSAADILTSDRKTEKDDAIAVPAAENNPEIPDISETKETAETDIPPEMPQTAEISENKPEAKEKKICPACQNEMLDEDVFCNECGAKFE